MKFFKVYAFCTACLLMGGCTGETDSLFPADEIRLKADVDPVSALAATRGPVSNSSLPASGLAVSFARSDEGASGFTGYSSALSAMLSREGAVTFDEKQLYLVDGKSTRFVGWHPAGTFADGVVTFPIDGVTDVMTTQEVEGNKNDPFGTEAKQFTFSHRLARVVVSGYTADDADAAQWGEVTSVTVKGLPGSCTFTLPSSVDFSSATADFTLKNAADDTVLPAVSLAGSGASAAKPLGYLLFAPGSASLDLVVTTSRCGDYPLTVALSEGKTFEAGKVYTVHLEFATTAIRPAATITDWTDSEGGAINKELN